MERTLCLVKPDGVSRNLIGEVIRTFEAEGLRVVALKMLRLSLPQAQRFYAVHRERPFFESLTRFVSSGPLVAMVLEGPEAISRVRRIIGATDPREAAPGTIRARWAENVERNVVHASDGPESAAVEIPFFFSQVEIQER